MASRIWLSSPHLGGREMDFIQDAFAHNWIAPLGANVDRFEADLQTYLNDSENKPRHENNRKYITALNTGTAALHLALVLLNVQPKDVVICQSLTFAASANPILYLGAEPVFVDSEADTWNISPEYLELAIQESLKRGKTPKAIVVVDLYGMPAKWDEILSIAKRYEIPIIEDAAEALGSSYKGKKCGNFGELAVLSFNGNKIITTSGGGALVCSTSEQAEKALFLATQARDSAPHYQHSEIGYNYRMSNISAGIGCGQMLVLEDRISARRAINTFYRDAFSDFSGVSFQTTPNADFFSNYWLSCVLIDPAKNNGINREVIRLMLAEYEIESRPLWKPMHLQPLFSSCFFYGDGTSQRLFENGLCLPSGSNLSEADKNEIAERIKNLLANGI